MLSRETDLMLEVPIGVFFWPNMMHKLFILFFSFPLSRHPQWNPLRLGIVGWIFKEGAPGVIDCTGTGRESFVQTSATRKDTTNLDKRSGAEDVTRQGLGITSPFKHWWTRTALQTLQKKIRIGSSTQERVPI